MTTITQLELLAYASLPPTDSFAEISTYIHSCATYLVYACLSLLLIPFILATTTPTDLDPLKKGKYKTDQVQVPNYTAKNSRDKEPKLVDLVYSDLPAPGSLPCYAIYDKLDPSGANLSLLFNKRNPLGVGAPIGTPGNALKVANINGTDTVYLPKQDTGSNYAYVNDLNKPTTLSDTSNLHGM